MRVRQPVPSKRLGKFVAARLAEHYLKLQQLHDEVREAEAAKKQLEHAPGGLPGLVQRPSETLPASARRFMPAVFSLD